MAIVCDEGIPAALINGQDKRCQEKRVDAKVI
jgi:hypothetical protein